MSAPHFAEQGAVVLRALAVQPGGAAVLAVAERRTDLVLVGGAVRDLLIERAPRELDVTVAEGAAELAAQLAAQLNVPAGAEPPRVVTFERFGTASVEWRQVRIDIAQRRRETYRRPGALPEVQAGDLIADLARRDFTLNAIALTLGGKGAGQLQAAEHGLEDLEAGRLRVLHDRSFLDDPTRLLRLARYSGRLGFRVERRTDELARRALAEGALASVSGARLGAELWLALSEQEPLAPLVSLEELGILSALGRSLAFDRPLAQQALELLPPDGSPAELLMAILIHPRADRHGATHAEAAELINAFEIPADARERIVASANATAMVDRLQHASRPSQQREVIARAPLEGVALAAALAWRRSPELGGRIARWLGELRAVRLRINGEDLLAAGVAQGPQLGRRLAHVLDLKLDGEIPDSAEAELQAALEVSP